MFYAFCGADYYPTGGVGDLIGVFNSVNDAKTALLAQSKWVDWWHIADTDMEIVEQGRHT